MHEIELLTRHEDDSGDPATAALELALRVTRSLLWITSAHGGREAAARLVLGLGAELVDASDLDATCLPIDVSFGDGPPVVPSAPPGTTARRLLELYLPALVADINRAIALASEVDRLQEDATVDALTGLPNRRHLGRALGRLRPGDVVVLLDLDRFKQLNDDHGHAAGDAVLRAFGHTLRSCVRARDVVGRYGGEEFVIILGDGNGGGDRIGDAEGALSRLRSRWAAERPHAVTFTAGLATVSEHHASATAVTAAADRAMYRAKRAGRDRWLWARADEFGSA